MVFALSIEFWTDRHILPALQNRNDRGPPPSPQAAEVALPAVREIQDAEGRYKG